MKISVSFQCSPETVHHGWDTKHPSRQTGFTDSHQPGLTGCPRAVQGQRDCQRPGGSWEVRCLSFVPVPWALLLIPACWTQPPFFSALGPRM